MEGEQIAQRAGETDWDIVIAGLKYDLSLAKAYLPEAAIVAGVVMLLLIVLSRLGDRRGFRCKRAIGAGYRELGKRVFGGGTPFRFQRALFISASFAYLDFVIHLCFLNRGYRIRRINLALGSAFHRIEGYHLFIENVLLFIPAGALLYWLFNGARESSQIIQDLPEPKGQPLHATRPILCTALSALSFSFLIELAQWITEMGESEADDLASNTMGALIGYMLAAAVSFLARRIRDWGRGRGRI